MPNHVTNVMILEGPSDLVASVLEQLEDRDDRCKDPGCAKNGHKDYKGGPAHPGPGSITFEQVVPSPEDMFRGDLGREDQERCAKQGTPTWYDWQRKHWGTKWNAYRCRALGKNGLIFETAWSTPEPVFHAMVNAPWWPYEVNLHVMYADEDEGYNLGYFRSCARVLTHETVTHGTPLAWLFALAVQDVERVVDGSDGSAFSCLLDREKS